MVVFACNSCGASLKKNQVDKHAFQCRVSTVSCMDCQKDFSMQDYGAHIKCISEVEKYSATGWKAPANFNKGEKKQQAWVDTVNDTLKKHASTLTPKCRSLLQTIAKHDNVPRKKPKFMNFITNVTKNYFDHRTVEEVWTMVDEEWKAQAAALKGENDSKGNKGQDKKENSEQVDSKTEEKDGESNEVADAGENKLSKREKKEARRQKQHKEEKKEKTKKTSVGEDDAEETKENGEGTNGHAENGSCEASEDNKSKKESKKDKKKRKRLESGSEITESKKLKNSEEENENQENGANDAEEDESASSQDFKWGTIIKEVLEKQPNHEIAMKKLQKKVLSHYYAVVGDSKGAKSKEELISKLNKKLKKSQFKVFKDNVKLAE